MLQLRLDCDDRFYDNGLDLFPNFSCRLCHSRTSFFGRRLSHDALETVIQPQLVCIIAEVLILLVQTVVCEVCIWVVKVFRRVVLLRCQPHQAIFVQEDIHRVDY